MPKATKKAAPKKTVTKTSNSILENVNLTAAMSYFPYFIGAVVMYFLAEERKSIMKHIKYSAIIWVIAILLHVFLTGSLLGYFVLPVYVIASAFFAHKAYKGEKVQVEIFDSIEEKISDTIKK